MLAECVKELIRLDEHYGTEWEGTSAWKRLNSIYKKASYAKDQALAGVNQDFCIDPDTNQVFAEHSWTATESGPLRGNYACSRCGKGC